MNQIKTLSSSASWAFSVLLQSLALVVVVVVVTVAVILVSEFDYNLSVNSAVQILTSTTIFKDFHP